MNICESYVLEVIGEPYYKYDKWWVKCKFNSYGMVFEQTLMFDKLSSAKSVKIGDLHHL